MLKKPRHHFFVCNSFRLTGTAQGACNKKGSTNLLQYLEEEILARNIDGMVSTTGCLKVCEKGPVMIIQPENIWFGEMTEEKIDMVLDWLEGGVMPAEGRIA